MGSPTDQKVPVEVLASEGNTLKVRLATLNYPRFLLVEESQPGPMILGPQLRTLADGPTQVSFRTNLPVQAKLTWGPYPGRDQGGHVDLPKGTSFDYQVTGLKKLDGVQVTIEHDGLTTPWPRWPYDNAGVLWQAP